MTTRVLSPLAYCIVLGVLVLLTGLTVGVSFIPLSGAWHTLIGLGIGVVKATLVGLCFMHLIHSRRTTWAVVIVSLFWLTFVLLGLTFSDYTTRALFPNVPGH